ncbi:hypothetical protein [Streptomonospora litoralis]|uniref:hypothetical protein n=1 Tax=Streptomonospora litoralis TaxID=2498135 RepID=UPI001035A8B7|nr:hypothetical protein [Streptomonospora litoralis]
MGDAPQRSGSPPGGTLGAEGGTRRTGGGVPRGSLDAGSPPVSARSGEYAEAVVEALRSIARMVGWVLSLLDIVRRTLVDMARTTAGVLLGAARRAPSVAGFLRGRTLGGAVRRHVAVLKDEGPQWAGGVRDRALARVEQSARAERTAARAGVSAAEGRRAELLARAQSRRRALERAVETSSAGYLRAARGKGDPEAVAAAERRRRSDFRSAERKAGKLRRKARNEGDRLVRAAQAAARTELHGVEQRRRAAVDTIERAHAAYVGDGVSRGSGAQDHASRLARLEELRDDFMPHRRRAGKEARRFVTQSLDTAYGQHTAAVRRFRAAVDAAHADFAAPAAGGRRRAPERPAAHAADTGRGPAPDASKVPVSVSVSAPLPSRRRRERGHTPTARPDRRPRLPRPRMRGRGR